MKPAIQLRLYIPIALLVLSSLGCGLMQTQPTPTRTPTKRATATKTPKRSATPTETPKPTEGPAISGGLVHMWASAAEASAQYGDDWWSAMQASGEPNAPECGDSGRAWSPIDGDTVETLTLYYMEGPLYPTEINIHQNYNASQVSMVEVLDAYGQYYDATVYTAEPRMADECPYILSIPITDIDYPVMGVRITIDQSVLGLGWNEIDAVELVGYAEAGTVFQPTQASIPEGKWNDVYALPIFPTVDYAEYPDQQTLMFGVSSAGRLEVLNFLLSDLEQQGWLLDIDEEGNCRDLTRCTSKTDGIDYADPETNLWFLIPSEQSNAYLMLMLMETEGKVYVTMQIN